MGCGGSRSSAAESRNPSKVSPAQPQGEQRPETPKPDETFIFVNLAEPVQSGVPKSPRLGDLSPPPDQLSGSKLVDTKEIMGDERLNDMLATQAVQTKDTATIPAPVSPKQEDRPDEVEARRHSQVVVELVRPRSSSDLMERPDSPDKLSKGSYHTELEAHLNEATAFVPATNIQYEIPEAFKDKAPLVPVGFYSIEALETVQPEFEFVVLQNIVAITSEHTEGDFLIVVGLEADGSQTKYIGVGTDGKTCFRHTEKQARYNHLYHQGREFVAERGGGLLIQDDEVTVLEYKPKLAPGNCQFVDEFLFYLDEVSRVIRVEFEDDLPTLQRVISGPESILINEGNCSMLKIGNPNTHGQKRPPDESLGRCECVDSGPFQGEDEGAIERMQVSPAQRLFNLCDGRLRDGVDLNPKDERQYGRLAEYEVTHSVTLLCVCIDCRLCVAATATNCSRSILLNVFRM